MNRIKTFIGIAAFSLVVLALPSVASAQWGGYGNGRNDDYYGNNRNNRNNRNIQATVRNLKNRARNFERVVDRWDDRRDDRRDRDRDRWGGWGNNNGGYYSGNLEGLANSFKNAADDFADEYGRGRNLNGSADEARRLLDIGRQIDQQLYNGGRGNNRLANEWSQIRYDLQVVADVYGYGGYNNRNPNGRNRNNGDWRNRIPFPLPF